MATTFTRYRQSMKARQSVSCYKEQQITFKNCKLKYNILRPANLNPRVSLAAKSDCC